MRIWSILLIKSDLKWCIYRSISLFLCLYLQKIDMTVNSSIGGSKSVRHHMQHILSLHKLQQMTYLFLSPILCIQNFQSCNRASDWCYGSSGHWLARKCLQFVKDKNIYVCETLCPRWQEGQKKLFLAERSNLRSQGHWPWWHLKGHH